MNAENGIRFLAMLLGSDEFPMDAADLEEAVKIASKKSPSGAFDAAQWYYVSQHGSSVHDGYLAYAKGTRWLAVIRRNQGQQAFDAAVAGLRQIIPAPKRRPPWRFTIS